MTFEAKHTNSDFYPRPPRGGRPQEPVSAEQDVQFLSTPSARRATSAHFLVRCSHLFLSTPSARRATIRFDIMEYPLQISIHALREEGDPLPSSRAALQNDFYPRPPRGGRREALTPRP